MDVETLMVERAALEDKRRQQEIFFTEWGSQFKLGVRAVLEPQTGMRYPDTWHVFGTLM
jgi:hypothetical protein